MVTNDRHDLANKLIEQEFNAVLMTPTIVKENGCIACHILFTLVNKVGISEAAASDPALRNSIARSESKLTSPCCVSLSFASLGFSYSYRSKIRSPNGSIDAVQSPRSTFTGLHYDVQEIIAANDKVASIISASVKHEGNFFVIPPTGCCISYYVINVYQIEDSNRTEHKAIRDDFSFSMKLGLAGRALLRRTNMLGHNIL